MTALNATTSNVPLTAPLSRAKVGMASLIFMESAFFSAFLVTYLYYIGKSPDGKVDHPSAKGGPWLNPSQLVITKASPSITKPWRTRVQSPLQTR